MKPLRLIECVVLVSFPLLCGACTITFGPADGNGAPAGDNPSPLPAPEDPREDEPALDKAQQARKAEAEKYVAEVIYKGATIIQTIQLPSGDIVDGLDRATIPAPTSEIPPLPWSPQDLVLPPGVELGLNEVDQIPELAALVNTAAPFHRPTFWPYVLGETDAISIEDYLDRYQVGGAPAGSNRYAGLVSKEANRGVSGFMNQFRPKVGAGSFSLLEFAVACPAEGEVQEMVGVVISVDKANPFGANHHRLTDNEPRMHVEYAHIKGGKLKYSWDNLDGTFVRYDDSHTFPNQTVSFSTMGGPQVENPAAIFQSPKGDWWIAFGTELVGYYPAQLFTTLNKGACRTAWYGEVYQDSKASTVKTEMGSGRFAEAGPPFAAYVRTPRYYDLSWFGVEPQDVFFSLPNVPTCYNRSKLDKDILPFDSIFFLGGPGENDPGCQWPSP
jgi:Neprosin